MFSPKLCPLAVAVFTALPLLGAANQLGDLDGDGKATVFDLTRLIGHVNGSNVLTLVDQLTADMDQDDDIDVVDVQLLRDAVLLRRDLEEPELSYRLATNPKSVNIRETNISGASLPGLTVLIEGADAPQTTTVGPDGTFNLDITLRENQLNRIFVTVFDEVGNSSPPRGLQISHDAQPPSLFIDFPPKNTEVITETADIAGRVGDMLSGYRGLDVRVNGEPAEVIVGIGQNGTFERSQVPLELGKNQITVSAMDALGNTVTKTTEIYRIEPKGPIIEVVSGNNQATIVNEILPEPATIRIRYPNGTPIANKFVTFKVIKSNGMLAEKDEMASFAGAGLKYQTLTDADGLAKVYWRLGHDAGCGNNRLQVTSKDVAGTAYFCASAFAAPPSQINIGSGNDQRGATDSFTVEPLRVWVNDSCNGAEDTPVMFRVIEGDGKVDGKSQVIVNTARTGHAGVEFKFGPNPGNNIVVADFEGNPGPPATFVLYGVGSASGSGTVWEGIVLDNASNPIGGATCQLEIGGEFLPSVFSNEEGVFRMENVPAGAGYLHIEGHTANLLNGEEIPNGSFPSLHYEVVVVENGLNQLGEPVMLPPLDPANSVVFDNSEDVVLTCEGIEGLRMTVKAGSMRLADGTKPDFRNPATLSLNQVHHDDTPMPMPDGVSPPFAWTLQPTGATFDPPIEIEYPNMKGLAPGAVAYFLSYDHDMEEFVIVASGSVADDGSIITTDEGVGLDKAGWGCNCPPYSVTASCEGLVLDNVGDIPADFLLPNPNYQDPYYRQLLIDLGLDPNTPWMPDLSGIPGADGVNPNNTNEAGDPVILSTGEFRTSVTDLKIPGRGIDFEFTRTYRSRFNFNGPIGRNWDHSYNRRLDLSAKEKRIGYCNGFARIDQYIYNEQTGKYDAPAGYFDELTVLDNGYLIRDRYGFKTYFDSAGQMTRREDRNGNYMEFEFDGGNLVKVIDTLGREINFEYSINTGRLRKIIDFDEREVGFQYDRYGNLSVVRSPSVEGTSTGNDFPTGKITRYDYQNSWAKFYSLADWAIKRYPILRDTIFTLNFKDVDGRIQTNSHGGNSHGIGPSYFDEIEALEEELQEAYKEAVLLGSNLTTITDGNGNLYLKNFYSRNDPDSYTFDRVIRQQWGNSDQIVTFNYESLNYDNDAPTVDTPRNQTEVIDRNGNRRVVLHNFLGNALKETVFTNRNINPNDPDAFATIHQYNGDGQRLLTRYPEGNETEWTYDTANADRLQQSNLRSVVHRPGPRGADQDERRTTFKYEPVYNQLARVVEARGNDPSYTPQNGGANSPERYTQTFFFDYQEGPNLQALSQTTGRDASLIASQLADCGIELNLGDINGDGATSQIEGNVVRHSDPPVILPDGSTQIIQREFVHNAYGQITKRIDPEGNVDWMFYHPENDPDGNGQILESTRALNTDTGGYLHRIIQDAEQNSRRDSNLPLAQIETASFYDSVGNLIRSVDGRGNETLFEVNALNQIVKQTRAAPFFYERTFFYDENNNVVKEEIQNKDTNGPGLDESVIIEYTYDILDNLTSKSEEVAANQAPLIIRFEYDKNENLVTVIKPEGNVIRTLYDERDLAYRVTRGAGTAAASAMVYTYDGNRNLIASRDAKDNTGDSLPETTIIVYDGFDRKVATTDGIGNRSDFYYDPAGHLVRRDDFGPNGGPSPTNASGNANVLLAQTTSKYDEAGRAYEDNQKLFSNTTAVGPEGSLSPNDGFVSNITYFDRNARKVLGLDDNGNPALFAYDGVDRVIRTEDAIGNTVEFEYDANSNLVKKTETDISPEGTVSDETFVTEWNYDSLDRVTSERDNLGNLKQIQFDSRDNITRSVDAMGNVSVFVYDGLDRLLSESVELRVGGTGTGQIDLSNPSNSDGKIVKLNEWDRNSRLISEIDDNGSATRYRYDALDRVVSETFADGTQKAYAYDRDDNLVSSIDQNGNVCVYEYDGIDRLISKTIQRAQGIEGTTEQTFQYDGLSRRTRSTDNNDPDDQSDDAIVTYDYDSLSRLLQETQNGVTISSTYDGVGRLLSSAYPNGRIVENSYDDANRVKRIADQGNATAIAEYDYIGYRVLERRYANGVNLRYHDGNGNDNGYDGLKRVIRKRHESSSGELLIGHKYAYDRTHNRRYEWDLKTNEADVYEYDSAYRLTRVGYDVSATLISGISNNVSTNTDIESVARLSDVAFYLDGVGNWQTVETDETPTQYVSNEMNEYDAIGGIGQVHDDNGNLEADGQQNYVYDALNRLLRVEDAARQEIAGYSYDAHGRRIEKTVGGAITRFYYDDDHVIEERDGNGATLRQFVFGITTDDVLQLKTGSQNYYYHKNSIGSVMGLSDGSGQVVEPYEYDAYGSTKIYSIAQSAYVAESTVGNPFGFTGRRIDAESGLYYYRARHYAPERGRFLQRDPIGYEDGMGLYNYVGNNPVNFIDPWGFEKTSPWDDFDFPSWDDLKDMLSDSLDNAPWDDFDFPSWDEMKDQLADYRSRAKDFLTQAIGKAVTTTFDSVKQGLAWLKANGKVSFTKWGIGSDTNQSLKIGKFTGRRLSNDGKGEVGVSVPVGSTPVSVKGYLKGHLKPTNNYDLEHGGFVGETGVKVQIGLSSKSKLGKLGAKVTVANPVKKKVDTSGKLFRWATEGSGLATDKRLRNAGVGIYDDPNGFRPKNKTGK